MTQYKTIPFTERPTETKWNNVGLSSAVAVAAVTIVYAALSFVTAPATTVLPISGLKTMSRPTMAINADTSGSHVEWLNNFLKKGRSDQDGYEEDIKPVMPLKGIVPTEGKQASAVWVPISAFFAGCLVAVAGLAMRVRPQQTPVCLEGWSTLAAVGGSQDLTEVPEVIGQHKAPDSLHRRMEAMLRAGQDKVCAKIEEVDGGAKFQTDSWIRAGSEAAGGGGISRVLTNGNIWEKAGVNLSVVWGQMPQEALAAATEKAPEYIQKMGLQPGDRVPFFVAGLSCVMHPRNPHCPTMHFNYRYFELDADNWWFGGGTDITPAYLDEEDMVHFHGTYKKVCDKYDPEFHPRFKKWADKYFLIKHRGETRGLGGIFFDDLNDRDPEEIFKFCEECLDNVLTAYVPIIEKHKDDPFTEEQKRWQLIRRGRYAEFNLVYDRGTLFGLRAGGRIESILMTIPEVARWEYAHQPEPGSEEDKIMQLFKNPRDFV